MANRGEIALRVIRTLREMDIESVAVYSDEDVRSAHVFHADMAKRIGKAPSKDSYLKIKNIIKAAKATRSDALHPGYGFLAENPELVKECSRSGIEFIGPSAKAMASMGDKIKARLLMEKAKVPIIPGNTSGVDTKEAAKIASKIGYPVLLKATAGGGGKGMRKVESESQITEAFKMASSEAKKAFGNPVLYIEKFIENPRHIEVQILGDHSGKVSHVYNRECSVQRRHQKIIEEAPAPNLSERTAKKMFDVACKAAKAIGYTNAGTVEFIVDAKENFYFLEMNTRLQVEHPVSEMITGLDLVREQLNISQGGALFDGKALPKLRGSALECRIYAEDPENNFAPCPGEIFFLREPAGNFVRVDSGIWQNSKVSLYYDPLLAKLITWAAYREEGIKRMLRALGEYRLAGIRSNLDFLKWVLITPAFLKGRFHTNMLESMPAFKRRKISEAEVHTVLAALAHYDSERAQTGRWDLMGKKRSKGLPAWKAGLFSQEG